MDYVWSILQGRAEFLARKAHVDGGNQERENKNPHTTKDSRGIGGGVGVSTILQVLFFGLNNVNSMKLLLLSHNIN